MGAIGLLLNLSRGEEQRIVIDKLQGLTERKKAFVAVYGRARGVNK